jgi:hypothetical protein
MNPDRHHKARCRLVRRELAQVADQFEARLSETAAEHLRVCPACRERSDELEDISAGLQALPLIPLPAARVDEILARTCGTAAHGRPFLPRRRRLLGLGAAAAVGLALPWLATRVIEQRAAAEQRTQAAAHEAEMVLALAAGAMERVEDAAIDRVLGRRVPGVLGHVLTRAYLINRSVGPRPSEAAGGEERE